MASWERGYGDFAMVPDFATMRRIPWLEGTALVLCDVAWNDGTPVRPSPRQVLKAQVDRARALGYEAMFGSELEFYLIKETYAEAHQQHYRGLTPSVPYILDYHILATSYDEPFIRAVRNGMQAAGIRVENSKGEAWPGQQEINFRYSDAVTMADNHTIYKNGIKEIAQQRGCSVTFMAKPDHTWIGSSCHIHSSLWRDGDSAFAGESPVFRQYLAGQVASAAELAVFLAPNINSYKRYTAGSWAPTTLAWGYDNRTCGFRVVGHGNATARRVAHPGCGRQPIPRVRRAARGRPRRHRAAARAAARVQRQRVRIGRAALPALAARGDLGARDGHARPGRVRRRRRRPLPQLRADGAAPVRPRGHLLRARALLRTRMTLRLLNPATEQPLAELETAGVEETDRAVAAAKAAFPGWRAVAPTDRARLLRRLAGLVEEHAEELALLETRNVGKPIADSRGEVGMVADVFHFYAGAVDKHYGQTIPVAGGVDMTFREPLGVVGLIVPWNFPLNIASWKVGPALACGNTVVLKPAELTPMTALRLGELALDAGIPEGVFNVLVGPGRVVGERLIHHRDVAKIGFTGSTEVGAGVMRGAAETIKRVTLELGGKSANVVFADADLERAAAAAPYAVFGNAGQDCCARSRILVQREAYDRFVDLLVKATAGVRVGDPEDATTEMGPLVSAHHRETVASYVDAEPFYRGTVPEGPGFWYPCTLVEATNNDRVAREEVFGPVAAIIPFTDEADAVRIANDTPYGLSGSIWTANGARALRVARALDTGVLSINSNSSVRVSTPFGGFKQSGFGRELGMHGLDGYSEVKNVFMSTEG